MKAVNVPNQRTGLTVFQHKSINQVIFASCAYSIATVKRVASNCESKISNLSRNHIAEKDLLSTITRGYVEFTISTSASGAKMVCIADRGAKSLVFTKVVLQFDNETGIESNGRAEKIFPSKVNALDRNKTGSRGAKFNTVLTQHALITVARGEIDIITSHTSS